VGAQHGEGMGTSAWSRSTTELLIAYVIVAIGLALGLRHRQASWATLLTTPLLAVPVAVIAVLILAAVRRLLMPSGQAASPWVLGFVAAVVLVGTGYLAGMLRARQARSAVARGTRLAFAADAPRAARPNEVTFAGVRVPPLDETKHFKLIGTTGTGKSTCIRELLRGALERGDRAVIADPDGGYLSQFYQANRGDIILNPFDPRSARWDLFGEVEAVYDADQLARSLIPDFSGEDRTWRNYARTFLGSVIRQMHRADRHDLTTLYRLLTSASTEELRDLLGGTAAAPFVAANNEKFFASVRAVTNTYTAALEQLEERAGAPAFSVRQWVRGGNAGGKGSVLFLPYSAGQIATLRNVISAWMRLAIYEAMSLGEGDQRLWFVVDELDALGTIDGLKDALARLRKFGGRCVLGFQSIAQVSTTYGAGEAQTIVENCGNTLILRCSASEDGGTARFASKLIGEREVIREQVSHSRRLDFFSQPHSSVSRSLQHVVETAVLPSEIEQLPDLVGYLKLASRPEWVKIQITP
jgi:type IV secretory pathway TraG/TraD family ATPase VirD4